MALRPRLSQIYEARGQRAFSADEQDAFFSAIVDGSGPAAFDAVVEALEAGVSLSALVDGLTTGAAERLLRFDAAIDLDPTIQNNWLDVTHILTFADALAHAIDRWHDPGIIELLLQGARFVNHARPLDLPPERRWDLSPASDIPPNLPEALFAAIDGRRTQEAIALAAAWHASGGEVAPLRIALEDRALHDPAVQPIVVAHHIKTTFSALDRYEALAGDRRQALPLLAAVHFLASPIAERRVGALVHDAIQLVAEGRVPKTLTG